MNDGNLEIIYKDTKPYGIRNKEGFVALSRKGCVAGLYWEM